VSGSEKDLPGKVKKAQIVERGAESRLELENHSLLIVVQSVYEQLRNICYESCYSCWRVWLPSL
jgi:hypothetical protein